MKLESLPRNLRTFLCIHVAEELRPINLVVHEDGDVCFLCGESDHANSADDYVVAGIGHLLDRDVSLHEIGELPDNHQAERQSARSWIVSPIEAEEKAT